VVRGFEAERQAAREAISLLDLRPVMCEDFGARPYSSELACISEAEKSDAYVLLMGNEYGFETDEGISVTQAEFRAAQRSHRPILAFVQDTDYSGKQAEFKREVESYQGGLFRDSFSNTAELKDGITRSLNRLKSKDQAISPEQFEHDVREALVQLKDDWAHNDDPKLILAFKPQPERRVNLTVIESSIDDLFVKACRLGYCQMRDGYESISGADWAGIKSGPSKVAHFSDGLVVLTNHSAPETVGLFAGNFLPPEILSERALSFLELIDDASGFAHLALRNMENGYVAKHPGGDSLSMRMWGSGENEVGFSNLFVPLSPGEYSGWVDWCIGKLRRTYPYENN
tara:strand:+ start:28278 stop:29306 length:1029 start_codon:yes stop_codon:yes gene_type:complete